MQRVCDALGRLRIVGYHDGLALLAIEMLQHSRPNQSPLWHSGKLSGRRSIRERRVESGERSRTLRGRSILDHEERAGNQAIRTQHDPKAGVAVFVLDVIYIPARATNSLKRDRLDCPEKS